MVEKEHKKRWKYASEGYINELYDRHQANKTKPNEGKTDKDFIMEFRHLDLTTKEGKMLLVVLSDVTSRNLDPTIDKRKNIIRRMINRIRKWLSNLVYLDKGKPDSTWHVDDAMDYYSKQVNKVFID